MGWFWPELPHGDECPHMIPDGASSRCGLCCPITEFGQWGDPAKTPETEGADCG